VLVVDDDLEHARRLATRLAAQGCITRALERVDPTGTDAEDPWEVVLASPAVLEPALLDSLRRTGASLLAFVPRPGEPPPPPEAVTAWLPRRPDEATLRAAVGGALEHRALERENRDLRDRLAERHAFGQVLTRDPAMRQALATLEAVADTRANVLLTGESGTGKTLLAHAIHSHSDRAQAPFVVVNCGALPSSLLESELFGHVRGAFSGAVKDRPGRFEQADGGTIFLDEVNSASLDMQVKLLRVLQDRTFERVGDGATCSVDVRVIAASNADLEREIEAGRFREDLFWRLHVVAVELPPLRERPRDVALLAQRFLERYAREYDRPARSLHRDSMALLAAHPWPGNVRQLENVIERAVLMARGALLEPADLGPELAPGAPPEAAGAAPTGGLLLGLENLSRLPTLKEALEGPERQILTRALELCRGSRKAASEMLGINRTTLFNKMRKYGLMHLTFETPAPPQG